MRAASASIAASSSGTELYSQSSRGSSGAQPPAAAIALSRRIADIVAGVAGAERQNVRGEEGLHARHGLAGSCRVGADRVPPDHGALRVQQGMLE